MEKYQPIIDKYIEFRYSKISASCDNLHVMHH